MNKKPNYPVLTLQKSLEIIDILAKNSNNRGLGISELSRMLDMGKSTIHRILDTLAYFKYVEKDAITEKYKLSWGLFNVGQAVPKQNQLTGVDNQLLKDLSNRCQETVNMGVLARNEVVIIAKSDTKTNLKAGIEIGGREPLHATAMGKTLIHELDKEELARIFEGETLPSFTPNTLTSLDALVKELEKVKQQGFAVDDEEYCLGLRCIAMPLRDYTNGIVAAVSISAPALRMNYSKLMEAKEELAAVCKTISQYLGHPGMP
ncbi:IclR family transcriptional regulator [Acetonema longum]|uniref:Transcriptional regulator IclR-like protein n=1 Tax=Acetonema longum DSM 6540 TaxID=1009370 RepID=F7NMW9_9FIRM|nr:IclR family transcriptional regulator [Acetonema longum]EGO62613.1 transcriptional regulator IclR-like protein [Acetonema longum DSM 6540]